MPGRDPTYIPTLCHDARVRRVPLFNPAVAPGDVPADTDFAPDEWAALVKEVHAQRFATSRRRVGLSLTMALAVVGVTALAFMPGAPTPKWLFILAFTTPFLVFIIFIVALHALCARTLGAAAFQDVADSRVVHALLRRNRCPSCAYRLPSADTTGHATCPECGAVWRSNINSSPPPHPSPCTSQAPSQDPPR